MRISVDYILAGRGHPCRRAAGRAALRAESARVTKERSALRGCAEHSPDYLRQIAAMREKRGVEDYGSPRLPPKGTIRSVENILAPVRSRSHEEFYVLYVT